MNERYQKGIEAMRHHLGDEADNYVKAIEEVAPLFARVNVEFAFGDIYGDATALDQKTRELATIAALTRPPMPTETTAIRPAVIGS